MQGRIIMEILAQMRQDSRKDPLAKGDKAIVKIEAQDHSSVTFVVRNGDAMPLLLVLG